MVRIRWSIVVLGLAMLVLTSCDTTPKQPEGGRSPASADEGGRAADEAKGEETVIVPRICVEQMEEFFNREQLLLADRVVIDASANPFFAAMSAVSDRQAVEKTEAVDTVNKVTILRYRNKTGQRALETVLPKIRVGDGFLIVATQEIVVRFHKPIRAARPVYFELSATGDVVYSDSHGSEPLRKGKLGMELEIRSEGSGYMFDSRLE